MAVTVTGVRRKDRDTVEGTTLIDGDTTPGIQPVGRTGFTLVMSEEFNGTMVVDDAGLGLVHFRPGGMQWSTWYPNWTNFTSQSPGGNHTNTGYDAYYDTSKVSLVGGALKLECDLQTTGGLPYTAGMIQSLPSYNPTAGFFEARLKMDAQAVNGHWPAFWMSCSNVNQWPPEIDIMEYFWSGSNYEVHIFMPGGGGQFDDITNNAGDLTQYHVFGCDWNQTNVRFYLDGTLMATAGSGFTPDDPQYLILNNGAREPANPNFASNDVYFDYVRAWV